MLAKKKDINSIIRTCITNQVIVASEGPSYHRPSFAFSEEELKVLNDLRNDNNIVIMKPDKGNGNVILQGVPKKTKIIEITNNNLLEFECLSTLLVPTSA